jgi:tripartite-type tricarboxylate transporter receptor subunit TctC
MNKARSACASAIDRSHRDRFDPVQHGLAADDFYAGKTVNVIVGYGPGGGYDLYARLVVRHLGKHIPGQPSVVVQNMEGAGSLRAANYVFGSATQGGTVIAAVNQTAPPYGPAGGNGGRQGLPR